MERTIERTPEEVAEIERHKYFLSEKVGYDVGWEAAEKDWEANYAEQFRATQHAREKPTLHNHPHTAATAPRGGLRMLFHRMFSRNNDPQD